MYRMYSIKYRMSRKRRTFCVYEDTKRIYLSLSANVEYTPHGGDVTCSGCDASYRPNHLKMASMFLKEEKIYYKMVYYIRFSQSSEITLQS